MKSAFYHNQHVSITFARHPSPYLLCQQFECSSPCSIHLGASWIAFAYAEIQASLLQSQFCFLIQKLCNKPASQISGDEVEHFNEIIAHIHVGILVETQDLNKHYCGHCLQWRQDSPRSGILLRWDDTHSGRCPATNHSALLSDYSKQCNSFQFSSWAII